MANRTFDPVIKIIREQQALNRNKHFGRLNQFNNLEMKGLEMIDWACPASLPFPVFYAKVILWSKHGGK
ncbi:MAG: hypothetical protein LBO65_02115 [Spirochaetaceae bacterium]|jgi:hypothetical protein|nr:hypothetical protein [Spirochaetaceae bacterium]